MIFCPVCLWGLFFCFKVSIKIVFISNQRANGHAVSRLTVHQVWSTKCRFSVLKGDIQKGFRALLIEICDSEYIVI